MAEAKNLAVFLDGTWNTAEKDIETNIHYLYQMASGFPPQEQLCHYVRGVGTDLGQFRHDNILRKIALLKDQRASRGAARVRRLFGGLFGFGIADQIKEAYAFLVHHYDAERGDRIYLFGFSRGAFAARSLAGFVDKVGLVLKCRIDLVEQAYRLYATGKNDPELNGLLRKVNPAYRDKPLPVYLVGAWDTVARIGIPGAFARLTATGVDYHLAERLPSNVSHGRHALALHELRESFEPLMWRKSIAEQTLKQYWFAGAHADVGGGYKDSVLSRVSLRWMAGEAIDLQLKLKLEGAELADEAHEEIHHQIDGAFEALPYGPRKAIQAVLSMTDRDQFDGHFVHPSAIRRADRPLRYTVRRSVGKAFRSIDRDTAMMALILKLMNDPVNDLTQRAEHDPALADRFLAYFNAQDIGDAARFELLHRLVSKAALEQRMASLFTILDVLNERASLLHPDAPADKALSAQDRKNLAGQLNVATTHLTRLSEMLPSGALPRVLSYIALRVRLEAAIRVPRRRLASRVRKV